MKSALKCERKKKISIETKYQGTDKKMQGIYIKEIPGKS